MIFNRVLVFARPLVLALIGLALAGATYAGTIVSRTFASPQLARPWNYNVYVPDGYAESAARYPVLYLFHGYGGNPDDWQRQGHIEQIADDLIQRRGMAPFLIVMPDGGNSWYLDREEKMQSAVLQDLLPEVEGKWRALRRREGRLLGGYSMGAYGALRFALKYPDTFAAAALLSPAIYDPQPPANSSARRSAVFGTPFEPALWQADNYPALWDAYIARAMPVPIYILSGDDDIYFIEGEALRLYERLRRQRQPAELRIVDGGHDWAVWSAGLREAIGYLLAHADRPSADNAPGHQEHGIVPP